MLITYLLTYNNAFLASEGNREVPLFPTQGEIRSQYRNRPMLSPPLKHTWLVHSTQERDLRAEGWCLAALPFPISQGRLTKPIIPSSAPSSAYVSVLLGTVVVPKVWSRDPSGSL